MRKLFLLGMLVVVPFVFAVQYSGTDVEEMQKNGVEAIPILLVNVVMVRGVLSVQCVTVLGGVYALFVVVKELLIEEMGKKHVLIAMEKGNLSVDIAKMENVYVPVVMELVNRDM